MRSRGVSNVAIGLCVALLHAGAVLTAIGRAQNWAEAVGFPMVPIFITYLERFDPPWARYSDSNPVMFWMAFAAVWIGNFVFYILVTLALLSVIRPRPLREHPDSTNSDSPDSIAASESSHV